MIRDAVIAAAGLAAYLWLSRRFTRVWDGRIRAALSVRLQTSVQWGTINNAALTDDDTPRVPGWAPELQGTLGQQFKQAFVTRAVYLAVLVVLGVLPALAILGALLLIHANAVVVLVACVAVIGVFALHWVGTYNR